MNKSVCKKCGNSPMFCDHIPPGIIPALKYFFGGTYVDKPGETTYWWKGELWIWLSVRWYKIKKWSYHNWLSIRIWWLNKKIKSQVRKNGKIPQGPGIFGQMQSATPRKLTYKQLKETMETVFKKQNSSDGK